MAGCERAMPLAGRSSRMPRPISPRRLFTSLASGRALGINVSAIYFGLTCGPLFGGWVTQHISWRAVFFIHVPVALFVVVLARLKLEGEWKGKEGQTLDLAGSIIYGITIICLMTGLSTVTDWRGILLLTASCAGLAMFISYEKKLAHPLFDVRVFSGNRAFSFSCLASLTLYTCTFALTFLMSLYLQNVKGLSPQLAGVIMICQPVLMALLSPTTGKLSDKIEPRYLTASGMLLIAVGLTLWLSIAVARDGRRERRHMDRPGAGAGDGRPLDRQGKGRQAHRQGHGQYSLIAPSNSSPPP